MGETSPQFHLLLCAVSAAKGIIRDLPERDVPDERSDLLLRSFSFLCHAALEEYLEDLSVFVASRSFNMFRLDGKLREPLVALCSYYNITLDQVDLEKRNSGDYASVFHAICEDAVKKHLQSIVDNNGIKTKDQDKLLVPVGCRIFDVDRILSQILNSFGQQRGEVAHSFRIKTRLPKAALEQKIDGMLRLLMAFDAQACNQIAKVYSY
jgi:hypothetical protein